METSTLTQKGQATIPKKIRDYLGIHPLERIAFYIKDDSVVIKRASSSTEELAGALESYALKPIPSKEELRKSMKSAAAKRDQDTL